MKIFEKIGNGEKVLFVGHPIVITEKLMTVVANNDVTLLSFNSEYYLKFYESLPQVIIGSGKIIPAYNLDNAFKSAEYRDTVESILDEIKRQKVTHALLNSNMWHPYYLVKLKELGIVLTTKIVDDPEGSKIYSEPIVRYYDKCICSGIDYDKSRTIKDMYSEWGAKEVMFLPVFVDTRHYDDSPIDFGKKDIDVVYVGSFDWKRWVSLGMIYRNIGKRIKLYSYADPRNSSGLNGLLFKMLNIFYPLPEIDRINDEQLKDVYKRSKLGFNKHLSYGPSNARSYELCLNGVMQITDNPRGYKELYSIGEEILCYRNNKEAIDYIKRYLKDDLEREKIAFAGYEKARKEYTYEVVFDKHIKYILGK